MFNGVLVTFLVDNQVFNWGPVEIGWLMGIPVLVSRNGVTQMAIELAEDLDGALQRRRQLAAAAAEVENAGRGVRVNALAPAYIATPMVSALIADGRVDSKRIEDRTPLKRFGTPEEIAAVAAWLASDQASYITGQTVYADGGRMSLNLTREPPADL